MRQVRAAFKGTLPRRPGFTAPLYKGGSGIKYRKLSGGKRGYIKQTAGVKRLTFKYRGKKFGTKRISEIFPYADAIAGTQLRSVSLGWALQELSLTPYMTKMLFNLAQKSGHGYQARWMKVSFLRHRYTPTPFYAFFSAHTSDQIIASIKDRGLVAGVRALGRRIVINPTKLFNKFHGESDKWKLPGVQRTTPTTMPIEAFQQATDEVKLFVIIPTRGIDTSFTPLMGYFDGRVGINVEATITAERMGTTPAIQADQQKINFADFFDIRLTIGYVRVTN